MRHARFWLPMSGSCRRSGRDDRIHGVNKRRLFENADHPAGGGIYLQTGRMPPFEFELLSDAYRETAAVAVQALARDDRFIRARAGSTAFRALPVIFLYRQALELLLKSIILTGSCVLDSEEVVQDVVLKEHNFERLRPFIEQVIDATGLGWNFGVAGLHSVGDFRRLLSEFDAFDPNSAVSRYPVDGAGNPAIEVERAFNLFNFAEALDEKLEALSVTPGAVAAVLDV